MAKFTTTYIDSLKPKSKKWYKREGNGFAICIYPSGEKSWFFIYTMDGKRHSMSLGSYPEKSLQKAREAYNAAWQLYSDGKNPAAMGDAAKEEHRKALAVADLITEYIEKHAKKFKRSWKEDERILNKDVLSAWGKRKAKDIVKRDVVLLMEKIIERGSPAMSNSTFRVVRKMFNFAVERDIIPLSPVQGVKPQAPIIQKERALSEDEIKTLWNSLNTANLSGETRHALKLILVTAQRPGEVSEIHTREIDVNWWTIPAERSKNGKTHRVYLSPLAQEIITEAKVEVKAAREKAKNRKAREAGEVKTPRNVPEDQEFSGYIFPGFYQKGEDIGKDKPIARHALSKALKRNASEDGKTTLGVASFTPHDLRRTAATQMSKMGEMDEVIDAVLNHAKQGIIKVYNQNKYDKGKQRALEAWALKLQSIISGKEGKVIPINRAYGEN